MATDIVIPNLGESISEAVVSTWLKDDGDFVERDEDIVELETDKVTMPLPSPVAGVLHHGAGEGDTVEVGGVLGSIDESAKGPSSGASKSQEGAKAEARSEPAVEKQQPAAVGAASSASEPARPRAGQDSDQPDRGRSGSRGDDDSSGESDSRTTPLARKLAQEHGVDLAGVPGTGPGGRIREQDVLAYIQTHPNGAAKTPTPTSTQPSGTGVPPVSIQDPSSDRTVTRERMSPLRQRIAVRLVEAQQTAAMLTTFNECDMSRVMAMRSKLKDEFQQKHGVKLGFMSFFVKACVSALQRVPNVNSFIVEGEKGPEVERHAYCDIAIAVGTEKGLVVPILRDCQALSFAQIEQGILDLAAKARDAKLTLEDMQGGTFTISNGGVYGSMLSTPILNPPQSGILGMHNIIRRPVEHPDKPGSGEVSVRPMMYLALSYDHRIVDGEGAVTFLRHVKECIEDPERLLIGV